jgi:hypothetical protein
MKEMTKKYNISGKKERLVTYKGQVRVQVWRDKRNVKFIFTLHTARIVETDEGNQEG